MADKILLKLKIVAMPVQINSMPNVRPKSLPSLLITLLESSFKIKPNEQPMAIEPKISRAILKSCFPKESVCPPKRGAAMDEAIV